MSVTNSPLISIALCTYNGEKNLREQLDSLVQQTYKNLEIVVVDDQSIDNTPAILKEYAQLYNTLRISTNKQNLGYTRNFEKAVSLCAGDYISLCDQDDIWDLNKIELLYNHIHNNILIYHDSEFVDESGNSIGKKMSDIMNFYQGDNPLPFLFQNCVSGHALMFKKELLKYVIPFDSRFFHDWWLVFNAASIGKINYLPNTLVKYRQHAGGTIDILDVSKKRVEDHLILSKIEWVKKCSTVNSQYQTYIKKIDALLNQPLSLYSKIRLYILLRIKVTDVLFIRKAKRKHNIQYLKTLVFGKY